MFASNLSVNEFVLIAAEGVRPLGPVMGSSVYQVGANLPPPDTLDPVGYEWTDMTEVMTEVYRRALARLQQAARQRQAHGVIGVRLQCRRKREAIAAFDNVLQVVAAGTAVAVDGGDVPETPSLCGLSGQEFCALRRSGCRPAGLVFGTCVFYQASQARQIFGTAPSDASLLDYNPNVERSDYTRAVTKARRLAMKRMAEQAGELGAEGIVGVTAETRAQVSSGQQSEYLAFQFTALGTAVISHDGHIPVIRYASSLSG